LSVFTPVSESQLAVWLKNYSVGALAALEPIVSGIENTNYFVTTTQGRYVLTLFERLPAAELPFYLELMAHLARHGIPCPAPIADLANGYLSALNGKPASLVTRLGGASLENPGAADCAELGSLLARMHLAGRSYGGYLENPRGPKWWRSAAAQVRGFLEPASAALLASRPGTVSRNCRAARCTRTCSATMPCSKAGASAACSTSILPASIALPSTSRSARTTGAWSIRNATGGSTSRKRSRCLARITRYGRCSHRNAKHGR
jgi:homoserine kinase